MKKIINKLFKLVVIAAFTVVLAAVPARNVKAEDNTAQAIMNQQVLLYQQQLAAIQAYQAALQAQYQQALNDQYAKALLVFTEAQINQQRAIQQAYMLNAVLAQQNAQYTSMLQTNGYEYQQRLLNEYAIYQQQALNAFKGYEGIK